jgi:hypothetical protein
MGWSYITEIKATNSNPSFQAVCLKFGEVFHQSEIVIVARGDPECLWVDECKCIEQMSVAGGVKLAW